VSEVRSHLQDEEERRGGERRGEERRREEGRGEEERGGERRGAEFTAAFKGKRFLAPKEADSKPQTRDVMSEIRGKIERHVTEREREGERERWEGQ